jgi:UDP:flavonoid glycosyltransferase YjiC (YdhE family)
MYEAVHSATPMLVIPHVDDQPRNAILITERGIGDNLEWPVDNVKLFIKNLSIC